MSIDAAEALVSTIEHLDLNEADTRFQIIDTLFERVLGWPRTSFHLEPPTIDGFADYHFSRPNDTPALIVEAKRTGVYFQLPENFNEGKKLRHIKIKALLSGDLKKAIIQAQRYAGDLGCEYAAVSNGVQFVFFKAFERDKAWRDLGAVVISDISWFSENYAEAISMFGYSSVIERASLHSIFRGGITEAREICFPKERINAYAQVINQNMLAPSLRAVTKKYFGPLAEQEPRLIEHCYVNQRAYDRSLRGVRTLIRDSVTPFFENYGVAETEDNSKGGALVGRVQKSVRGAASGSDVIVLFGGKGSGKSTFLWRALHHQPPQFIKKHAAVATLNMLPVAKDEKSIQAAIWKELVERLDTDKLLSGSRDDLAKLFEDRWEVACRQDFFGLDPAGEAYSKAVNAKIAEWKADLKYVSGRLAAWHARMHRGVVVVLDNTDQFDNELQDYSFTVAQEISNEFRCLVLISMREERFYASKIRGLLDAYQSSAFHISSPSATDVFILRLEYVIDELSRGNIEVDDERKQQLMAFLRVFLADFKRVPESPLNRFISACAHGNIRLALELFVELLLSGYTNAREMIESGNGWTILIHQVLRPLMSPTRLFYDEKLSKVLNIFQLRVTRGGSHFTGMRILRMLSEGQDSGSPSFVAFGALKNQFVGTFGAEDDFRAWLDSMLSANLVEASTRQDSYSEEIDAVRITSFGWFCLKELSTIFTYVELTSTDAGIRSESVCNELVVLTNQEVALMNSGERYERVVRRLEKAQVFLDYLQAEEVRELDFHGIQDDYKFMAAIREAFAAEREGVMRSAQKNARR